ncbi:hypothetical protein BOX15_Mlig007040g1, partial [Macrostomum lignano]
IGAGLMRTGTNSQMKALEILLGGRCYHMEVIIEEKRHHLKLWLKAATEGLTKELADEMLSEFRACTDFPAAHFYSELMQIYPEAKFILSLREPERWVQSVRATVYKAQSAGKHILPPIAWLIGFNYMDKLQTAMFPRMGMNPGVSDQELAVAFDRHTEAVIRTIPKERLLVFRVTDGWEPLCKFLNVPVPDVPFPCVNDTKEFQRKIGSFILFGSVLNVAFCTAVGAAVWFSVKRCLQL